MNPVGSPGLRGKAVSVWPTRWFPLPFEEHERALEHAGANGAGVLTALYKLRSLAPRDARDCFFASQSQISRFCGISERRIDKPLQKLEAAGLIKVRRPTGVEKLQHQANRYTLIPVFVTGNDVTGADKSSGPKRTKRPRESGQEVGTKMSVIVESPLTGGDSPRADAGGAERPPAGASESEKPRDNDFFKGLLL